MRLRTPSAVVKRLATRRVAAALVIGLFACQRHRHAGDERQDCRPDHGCEPGLVCLSNLCVRPPAADCAHVAEALASGELGNYAPPQARAPLVAAKRAACEAAQVSKDEAACLDKAHDAWSQRQCVPRMFPETAATPGECAAIAMKVRALIAPNVAQVGSDAAHMVDKMMPILESSCEHDGWPPEIKRCILATGPGDLAAMNRCSALMPKALQDHLQEQMTAAGRAP